jgi:metallo-beta-lactamase family protein
MRLKAILEHALADGGTVLIPAFSIGRTQELLYEIEGLIHEFGQSAPLDWSTLEIVVDSPLAANFTRIYDRLKHFWDAEAVARVQRGRHPLSFDQLTVIDDHKDHLNAVEYLARTYRPCVVLAGSGMCAGGWVRLDDERYDIRARIHQVGGYSAHAGQSDLIQFVTGIAEAPAEIRIVHGDAGAKQALKARLGETVSSRVVIPQ